MRFVLAPLAGFTDAPFRRLCAEGGASRCYTEMVSAAGLAHGNSPTRQLLETMEGEGSVACQIFGATESDVACAARAATARGGFVELNLNAGCPMTKVTRGGAGAKLVEDPAKVGRLLKAMRENTDLPVTLKTRLGPHPQDIRLFELLDAAQAAGARAVALHARFTSQMHGGPLHLELLAEAVRHARVPIIGNGSVKEAKDVAAMAATGVAEIMIGRAALADPAIFSRLAGRTGAADFPTGAVLAARHLGYALDFRRQLAARFPDDHIPSEDGYASVKMHVHLFRYFSGRPGAAALRARLNAIRTLDEVRAALRTLEKPDV